MVLAFNPKNWKQEGIIQKFFEWYDYDQCYGGAKENLKLLRHYINPIPVPESIQELDSMSQIRLIGLFLRHWDTGSEIKEAQDTLRAIRRKIQIETPTGIPSYSTCRMCSEEIPSNQIFCKKCENDFLWKEEDNEEPN